MALIHGVGEYNSESEDVSLIGQIDLGRGFGVCGSVECFASCQNMSIRDSDGTCLDGIDYTIIFSETLINDDEWYCLEIRVPELQ